jgi:hypothetical protein
MTSPKAAPGRNETRKAEELDRCYGRIGISAVAAALTFKGDDRNSADAAREPQR